MKISSVTNYQGIGSFGALNGNKILKNAAKKMHNSSIFNLKNLKATNKYEPKPNTFKGKLFKAIDNYLTGVYEEFKILFGRN